MIGKADSKTQAQKILLKARSKIEARSILKINKKLHKTQLDNINRDCFKYSLQYQMFADQGENKVYELVKRLEKNSIYERALEKGREKYQVRQYKICALTPQQILEMYNSLKVKFYFIKSSEDNESWYENELRIFLWLLIGHSFLENRCISEMNQLDWMLFSSIFNKKRPQMFQFQAYSLLKRELKIDNWELDEVSLLDSIIKTKSIKNKWNEIAKDLFIRSKKKYFRTAKQCREYWINHLDPVPTRSNWTAAEDYNLIETVKVLGKKWSQVSKRLGGRRTEHMVKNRFKALSNYELKRRPINYEDPPCEQKIIDTLSKRLKMNIEEQEKLENLKDMFSKKCFKSTEKCKILGECQGGQKQQIRDVGLEKEEEVEKEEWEEVENEEEEHWYKSDERNRKDGNTGLNIFLEDISFEEKFPIEKCFQQFFQDPDIPYFG